MSGSSEAIAPAVAFAMITVVTLGSALVAVFARSLVTSAFALFFTLLGMAGYYFLLGADFLGITQVIIYVGGILVILLFGILLTSRSMDQLQTPTRRAYMAGVAAGLALFLILAVAARSGAWLAVEPVIPDESAPAIGRLLLTDYLLVFEFSSITLLAALIGAAHLVRRRDR